MKWLFPHLSSGLSSYNAKTKRGQISHCQKRRNMLPLLPQTAVICLLIVFQCLILFIFQILIGSLLVLENGGLAGRLRLCYIMPPCSASLCWWIVFIHSASEQLLACWRQGWPPCPGATPLPHSDCCSQRLTFFSCLRSFWSFRGIWGERTCPLTLPQPLLLTLGFVNIGKEWKWTRLGRGLGLKFPSYWLILILLGVFQNMTQNREASRGGITTPSRSSPQLGCYETLLEQGHPLGGSHTSIMCML